MKEKAIYVSKTHKIGTRGIEVTKDGEWVIRPPRGIGPSLIPDLMLKLTWLLAL